MVVRIIALIIAGIFGVAVLLWQSAFVQDMAPPLVYLYNGLVALGGVIVFGCFIGSLILAYRQRRETAHRSRPDLTPLTAQERIAGRR